MATESNVRRPAPSVLNVSLPITACVFACAILVTAVVVTTIRRYRERRRTYLITPYCCGSLSSTVPHRSHTTQTRQRPSISTSGTLSPNTETSVSITEQNQSSMCKSPTTAIPYTIDIQNSFPPSFGTIVDSTAALPEHPPLLRVKTTGNHRQPRKLCRADMDVKERIMMTMYGSGQDRTSFLPRYQVRPNFGSDPSAGPNHRPLPAYQV